MSEENVEIVRKASDAFKAFMCDELSNEDYSEQIRSRDRAALA